MTAREPWTDEEIDVLLEAYFAMLRLELDGEPFIKARFNESVRARLGRSAGSVEFKLANVSAELRDRHLLYISGYKPRPNRQGAITARVDAFLQRDGSILDAMRSSVSAPAEVDDDHRYPFVRPPDIDVEVDYADAALPVARHVDFAQVEQDNRSLGLAGEHAVLAAERQRLIDLGSTDLAERVRHVSVDLGDGLGYDIHSFNADGSDRLIEVKTTRRDITWPFIISRREVLASRQLDTAWHLYRLFNFGRQGGIYTLPGRVENSCNLTPVAYSGRPRREPRTGEITRS